MKCLNRFKRQARIACIAVAASLTSHNVFAFDIDTGYAPLEVVVPNVFQLLSQDVSPSGSDATLVLRHTTMISNSWFDAVAPYHPTQVGVYSRMPERRTEEGNREKNTALLYATYRVVSSLAPHRQAQWDAMLSDVGLDPTDNNMDPTNPVGIGNIAGMGVVNARLNDGMNQLGNEGGVNFNRQPYKDYTGYIPFNSFYEVLDPSRWQPAGGTNGLGKFSVQQYVTPQMEFVKPYSYKDATRFRIPRPWRSNPRHATAYKEQADFVLETSANLTDEQKLLAELFDYKLRSLGFSGQFAAKSKGLGFIETIQMEFLANLSAFDTSIAVWHQKTKFDAVRPWTAITYLYGDKEVTAWGGPGKGTVTNIPANQWTSYLPVADHPEYPSGSAAFCAAHTDVLRKFFREDSLNWTVTIPQGGSTYEKGFTPQQDTDLHFSTWTELKEKCGQSRLYAGVHFPDSVTAGFSIGERVGRKVYRFVQKHIKGRVN